jgi:hypothetical protein
VAGREAVELDRYPPQLLHQATIADDLRRLVEVDVLVVFPYFGLVAGVKIGSGRQSDSRRPPGRGMPHTEPSRWYSRHPDPES